MGTVMRRAFAHGRAVLFCLHFTLLWSGTCNAMQPEASQNLRIAFLAREFSAAISGKPHRRLGSLRNGVWMEIPDDTLLAVGRPDAMPLLLYLSKESYEKAIRNLPPAEIENVIRKRLKEWSPDALDAALQWIYQREKKCLALTAQRMETTDARTVAVLRGHFENGLELLAAMLWEGRYDDTQMVPMLVYTLEGEARLISEFAYAREAALAANDPREADRLAVKMTASRGCAEALGRALQTLGRAEYAGSLPYTQPERVLFIRPRDEELLKGLKARGGPVIPWRDGVVAPLSFEKIDAVKARLKSVEILYLDRGEFVEDARALTQAQLDREFEERLRKRPSGSLSALSAHLISLQLEQDVLRRSAVMVARREHSGMVELLQKQVANETEQLRAALAWSPIWIEDAAAGGKGSLRVLVQEEQGIARDAELFEELSRRANKEELRSRFEAIAKAKRIDITRIAALLSRTSPQDGPRD